MLDLLLEIAREYSNPPNKSGVTVELMVEGAVSGNVVNYVRSVTGCAKQTVTNCLAKSFTDKSNKNESLVTFLLSKRGLKHCPKCGEVKDLEDFYFNQAKQDGYAAACKECSRASRIATYKKDPQKEINKNSLRKRGNAKNCPPWADMEKINKFYADRPIEYHVDHIVPLNGALVSGLHVLNNLQYLLAEDNLSKSNSFMDLSSNGIG